MSPDRADVPAYSDAVDGISAEDLPQAYNLYRKTLTRALGSGDIDRSVRTSAILVLIQRRLLAVA